MLIKTSYYSIFKFYLLCEINKKGIVQPRGYEVNVQKRIGLFSRYLINFDELLSGY